MATEIAFEYIQGALEATRATRVTPPTHYLQMKGTLTPMRELYKAPNPVGSLVQNKRTAVVHKWGELEAEGDLDIFVLPVLCNMALKGGVTTPTTPSGATLSRLWSFPRAILTDNLKSMSQYWGDPNNKIWVGDYGMLDELTIKSEPGGTDVAKMGVKGHTWFPVKLPSVPASPTEIYGPLIVPGLIQVWIDVASAIGTTEITGRVLNAEHVFNTGVTYKWPGQGPASGLNYHHTGRAPSECTTALSMDLIDQAQYDIYEGAQQAKVRVRHNGPLIEDVGGTLFYNYVQVDMYGTLDGLKWGDYEGNRTLELELASEENATAGTDTIVTVQSTRTSL